MKRMLIVFMLLVLTPSFMALASEYAIKEKTDNYNLEVKFDKSPPSRGNNNISIYIKDKALRPITDANVEVRYLMPSLPGRPPMMDYNTEATLSGNHYLAKMNLSMAGEWTIILGVTRAGKTETMRFSFVLK